MLTLLPGEDGGSLQIICCLHRKFVSLTERNIVKVLSCLIWYEWQDVSPTCAELNRKSVVEEAVLGWEAKVGSGLGESHT